MINIKNILIAAGVGLLFTGCQKKYLDINTNPNSLTGSTPDFVFTAGANRTAAIIGPNELGEYWSGQWTQSTTYAYSQATFAYDLNNTTFNYWDTWYDVAFDFQYVIDNAVAKGLPFFKGPARVMKTYIMQQVVDAYGNAPYSEAFKGVGALAPKFDDAQAIYTDLIVQLDTAISDLRANAFPGAYQGNDIVFKGDRTKWVRFANTLKLRILMRQSKIAGRDTYIKAEINKAAASTEGFLVSGQDVPVNPGFAASAGQTNPIYNNWGYSETGAVRALARYPRPTKFLFDQLIAANDTFRLKRLAYAKGGESTTNFGVSVQPEIVANYVGVPYGAPSGYLAQNTSYIGPSFIIKGQVNKDVILMTAAESYFLLAEAKETYTGGVTLPSTSQVYYEQGVREAFRITGTTAVNSSAATLLLTSGKPLADWTASPNKLQAIWQQKWLALTNFSGFEAWADYRRTNFPVTPESAGTSSARAVRLVYPATELQSNEANVKAQGTIDFKTKKIFWDVD